ncbi:hypothetical protein [Haloterrigena alkaliphila]|uniref:Uncharacterized protein n=1 Tax=Haloterrigena alkaliphila TaxID=2816475 RepID=A0A8A2VSB5_9EURY|nr:hypothetical protein [Haloterrigena alkaliphila]QSX00929.1 hypothetical protein J0X25_08205 [Haloterrigena alkaliphila]
MNDPDWKLDRREGVTFVSAIVTNTQTTPQRTRLESRLEGPTWPPRRDGATRPEWKDHCWEGTVEPGRSRGIGFASPAPPVEPPVEIVAAERATDEPTRSTDDVIAGLDGWAPPTDVLTRGP